MHRCISHYQSVQGADARGSVYDVIDVHGADVRHDFGAVRLVARRDHAGAILRRGRGSRGERGGTHPDRQCILSAAPPAGAKDGCGERGVDHAALGARAIRPAVQATATRAVFVATLTGIVTRKEAPSPGPGLVPAMLPPSCCAATALLCSPKPCPCALVVKPNSQIRGNSSAGIPTPVSSTAISSWPSTSC